MCNRFWYWLFVVVGCLWCTSAVVISSVKWWIWVITLVVAFIVDMVVFNQFCNRCIKTVLDGVREWKNCISFAVLSTFVLGSVICSVLLCV